MATMFKTITTEEFKALKKDLAINLAILKKGVNAVNNNDIRTAVSCSKSHNFKYIDTDITPMMFDIITELSKTRCDDNYKTKSTAMFSQFNRNWTIGSFGSVFVDIIVKGKKLRVSFFTKAKTGDNQPAFWLESLS